MRLWHDDVRQPPSGWVWAQNNDDAKKILKTGEVLEISMDHDLGASRCDGIYAAGSSADNGYELAKWMVANILVPPSITIHSWNPVGAGRMAGVFNSAGYDVVIVPYQIPQVSF